MIKIKLPLILTLILFLPMVIKGQNKEPPPFEESYKMDYETLRATFIGVEKEYIHCKTITKIGVGSMVAGAGLAIHGGLVLRDSDFSDEGNSYGMIFLLEEIGGIVYFVAGAVAVMIFAPEMVRYNRMKKTLELELIQYKPLSEFHHPGLGIGIQFPI